MGPVGTGDWGLGLGLDNEQLNNLSYRLYFDKNLHIPHITKDEDNFPNFYYQEGEQKTEGTKEKKF